ncbi:MAG: pyridoxal phosphate-dependent class II aminotransferase [Actinomycetota bacterium]|nr:pyridoxal phosphate-dependent class II aminotransferase [Actinomycetota bacterium]
MKMMIHGGEPKRTFERLGLTPREVIDFSVNINPFGPPKGVLNYLRSIDEQDIRDYPDPESSRLKGILSQKLGLGLGNLALMSGSLEAIHLVASRLVDSRGALIISPNFSEYEASLKAYDIPVAKLSLSEDDGFDLTNKTSNLKINDFGAIFLSNPNNPTGRLYDKKELIAMIQRAKGSKTLIVSDESFMDFVIEKQSESLAYRVNEFDNLIVLSSLTKFYSLAGLRIGCAIASDGLIEMIRQASPRWNLNHPAQKAAEIAILDSAFEDFSLKENQRLRADLYQRLSAIGGIKAFLSSANFILIKVDSREILGSDFFAELLKCGYHLRDCSSFEGLGGDFFRIAVRKEEENLALLAEMRKIISTT